MFEGETGFFFSLTNKKHMSSFYVVETPGGEIYVGEYMAGEAPHLGAVMAEAYVAGVQSQGAKYNSGDNFGSLKGIAHSFKP